MGDVMDSRQVVRRRSLLVGVGVAAALAGTGLGFWWNRRTAPGPFPTLGPDFWAQQWESPQGDMVRLAAFRGKPLLINFWATWCPPCVEELPLINSFYDKNKANGWQVLALAVDKLEPVQTFLKKMPLHFPVAITGLSGAELSRNLGNLAGGLPFSLVVDSTGAIAQRKIGRLSEADLQEWVGLK